MYSMADNINVALIYNSDTNYSLVDITLGSICIFKMYIYKYIHVSRLTDYPDIIIFVCTRLSAHRFKISFIS